MNKRKRKKRNKKVVVFKLRRAIHELLRKALIGDATEVTLDELLELGAFDDTKDTSQT